MKAGPVRLDSVEFRSDSLSYDEDRNAPAVAKSDSGGKRRSEASTKYGFTDAKFPLN